MAQIALFAGTDSNYIPYAQALCASFRHFHPKGKLFLYAVNIPDNECRQLERFGAILLHELIPTELTTATHVAMTRFCVLPQVLDMLDGDTLFAYDADTILRAPLQMPSSLPFDVSVRLRGGHDANRRIFAGVLALHNTHGALRFLCTCKSFLETDARSKYADQRCLFKSYVYHKAISDVTFDYMTTSKEMSRFLDSNALAWSPTPSKRRTSKFLTEVSYWQKEFARRAGIPGAR